MARVDCRVRFDADGPSITATPAVVSGSTTTPAPTVSAGSGGAIAHGVELTSANTGIASAGLVEGDLTSYTYSGPITGTLSRRVISTGSTIILGSGANLTECVLRSSAGRAVVAVGTNQALTRCDIEATNSGTGEIFGLYAGSNAGVGGGSTYVKGLHVDSLKITGPTIGVWHDGDDATDDAYIRDSYLYNFFSGGGGQHRDGFTRREGNGPIAIERCRIAMTTGSTTGAVFLQDTWNNPRTNAGLGYVSVRDCYLEGNGYPLTLEDGNNLVVSGNIIRPTEYGAVTNGGVSFAIAPANNNLYDSGNPPTYRGATVNV